MHGIVLFYPLLCYVILYYIYSDNIFQLEKTAYRTGYDIYDNSNKIRKWGTLLIEQGSGEHLVNLLAAESLYIQPFLRTTCTSAQLHWTHTKIPELVLRYLLVLRSF